MTDFLGSIAKELGLGLIKHARRSNAFDKIMGSGKQLVVLQPTHWLFEPLCQWKRTSQDLQAESLKHQSKSTSLTDLKAKTLSSLLATMQHKEMGMSSMRALSDKVLLAACVLSALLPDYEPLLVEVALTHCLHQWSLNNCDRTDVAGFEAVLMQELAGYNAMAWFDCQFFLDSVDVMQLAPYFYKTRIASAPLKELMSICIMESRSSSSSFGYVLAERLAKEKNKAARDGWMAFLGEELATVGSPQRATTAKSLSVLGSGLMNPTILDPAKHGYFPVIVGIRGFGSVEYADHSAVISAKVGDNVYVPGFIYDGA